MSFNYIHIYKKCTVRGFARMCSHEATRTLPASSIAPSRNGFDADVDAEFVFYRASWLEDA